MTHSYVWRALFTCVTWFIHMRDIPDSYVWHDLCTHVARLIHVCDMNHPYVLWTIHKCHAPHSYVWDDSFTHVTTHFYVAMKKRKVTSETEEQCVETSVVTNCVYCSISWNDSDRSVDNFNIRRDRILSMLCLINWQNRCVFEKPTCDLIIASNWVSQV